MSGVLIFLIAGVIVTGLTCWSWCRLDEDDDQ